MRTLFLIAFVLLVMALVSCGGGGGESGDDHGNTCSEATNLSLSLALAANLSTSQTVDKSLSGTVGGRLHDESDIDVFRVTITGGLLKIYTTGSGGGGDGRLMDSNCSMIASDLNEGDLLIERILPAGTYYIYVESDGLWSGGYTLNVEHTPIQFTTLFDSMPYSYGIDSPREEDWFHLNADCTGRDSGYTNALIVAYGMGMTGDFEIELYGEDFSLLAEASLNDDPLTGQTWFSAMSTSGLAGSKGDFFVKVFDREGTDTGDYQIALTYHCGGGPYNDHHVEAAPLLAWTERSDTAGYNWDLVDYFKTRSWCDGYLKVGLTGLTADLDLKVYLDDYDDPHNPDAESSHPGSGSEGITIEVSREQKALVVVVPYVSSHDLTISASSYKLKTEITCD